MENKQYQEIFFKAKTCNAAERFEDMAKEMKALVKLIHEQKLSFNNEMRNLFSVAYKNLVSFRRSSWRALCTERLKQKASNPDKVYLVDEMKRNVEQELLKFCDEVLELIDNYILNIEEPKKTLEHCIFFLKMKGDYYRYKAEVLTGTEHKKVSDDAYKAYSEATEKARDLTSTNPLKLGLALNFSVFYYEIQNEPQKACELAKDAFDKAIAELDTLADENYKDATLIMQLLRDNLTLWTARDDNNVSVPGERMVEADEN
jgi:14-3-3 protein beta/theta/zeta